jgi:CheY-like chemotaxis protein
MELRPAPLRPTSEAAADEAHAGDAEHVTDPADHSADVMPWAVLEVTDTGVGMSDSIRTQIFDPFFTTKALAGGTGLGLSVVYGIVSQSGGQIEVESMLGEGTTFRILLPSCPAATVTLSIDDAEDLVRGTETVLLVEDEDAVRALTELILRRSGYTVIAAENGEDAVRRIDALGSAPAIDLIVSDIVMPDMGGRELVATLANRGWDIPVLFVSGYTNDATPLTDMRGRPAALLSKPFRAHQLSRIVRETLDVWVA